MIKKPLISVVMPVYNAVSTIRKSVESILNQTFTDFELVIVVERDTNDGTIEILEEYAESDDRIKIIYKKGNKGIGSSLNIGINISKGKYIARMDADDYSYPERFHVQYEFMENNIDISACGTQMRVISGSGFKNTSFFCDSERLKAFALFFSPLPHPTVFIRKEFIDRYNLRYIEDYPNIISEDYELWVQILDKGGMIYNLDKVLLDYNYAGEIHLSWANVAERNDKNSVFIKRRIAEQFEIDTSPFSDIIFYPTVNFPDMIKSDNSIIISTYVLLSTIEEKNNALMKYDKISLMLTLLTKWNNMIRFRYVMDIDDIFDTISQISLSDLDIVTGRSFCDLLARKIGVTKEEITNSLEYLIDKANRIANSIRRVIVFGTGKVVKRYLPYLFNIVEVVAFCDNNADNADEFENKPLIKPNRLDMYSFDHILIGSKIYYDEVKKQLIEECGIEQKKIVSIEILHYRKYVNE